VEISYMNEKNEIMVSVRLPKTLVERIDETAVEEGRSRSGMIRRILDRYPESFVGGVRE
jgi:metal-responsive CopG/Arc/MetJ family transcriptional regulator